jgi:hypothetical protein
MNADTLVGICVDLVPVVLDDNGLEKASSALTSAIVVDVCKAYGVKARPQPCELTVYRRADWVKLQEHLEAQERDPHLIDWHPPTIVTSRYVLAVVEDRLSVDLTMGAIEKRLPRAASYEEALTRDAEMAWVHGELVTSYVGNTDDTYRAGPAWKGATRRRIAGFVIRQLDRVAREGSAAV